MLVFDGTNIPTEQCGISQTLFEVRNHSILKAETITWKINQSWFIQGDELSCKNVKSGSSWPSPPGSPVQRTALVKSILELREFPVLTPAFGLGLLSAKGQEKP